MYGTWLRRTSTAQGVGPDLSQVLFRAADREGTTQPEAAPRAHGDGKDAHPVVPPRGGRDTGHVKEDIAAYWDQRYRSQDAGIRAPAEFLIENLALLPPRGRVLDVAMGTGRHALFLASRGYEVTGVDISPVAVQRCQEEASRLGLRVEAICADLTAWPWPASAFDIVLDFYFLQRDLCPRIASALRPGGVLVFETFTTGQRQFGWGPAEDNFLLRPGELPTLFPTLHVIRYREAIVPEGDRGPKAVASLIARKQS